VNQSPARSSGQAVGSSVLWLRSGSVCLTRQASKPARAIAQTGPAAETLGAPGLATMQTESPLGPLMLAATPHGLIRVAFEGHGDFAALEAHASSRRGSRAARQRLGQAAASLYAYSAGAPQNHDWVVDWARERGRRDASLAGADPLRRPSLLSALDSTPNTRGLGRLMGANPIPIVASCHRVIHQLISLLDPEVGSRSGVLVGVARLAVIILVGHKRKL
jgi:methylated-DNA-[protein]-cysteine S-methyltransferase